MKIIIFIITGPATAVSHASLAQIPALFSTGHVVVDAFSMDCCPVSALSVCQQPAVVPTDLLPTPVVDEHVHILLCCLEI